MTEEHFDVLDCRASKTGGRISRDDAHKYGVWHGAFHCLIVYEHDGRPYALFQKRSAEKKIAPGRFDISVGGHYSTGEDASIAGPREIKEELGLDIGFHELLSLGRRTAVYCFTPGITEYEFQDVFLLPKHIRLEECALQQEEVEGLLEIEVEAGIKLFSGELDGIECRLLKRDSSVSRRMISAEEFVPCLDNYYLKLLLLARQYFCGERKLLII